MVENRFRVHGVRAAYLGLALLAVSSSGCLVAAAGATAAGGAALGYAYYMGEESHPYHAGLEDTWSATRAALSDLGMPVVKEENQQGSVFIESRTNYDDRVRIWLTKETSPIPAEGTLTVVGVRVGVFGDDKVSERVLAQVGTHLTSSAGGRLVPTAQAAPGPVQPVASWQTPAQTPPPPLASEPPRAR
jgi:hypothetical protein